MTDKTGDKIVACIDELTQVKDFDLQIHMLVRTVS